MANEAPVADYGTALKRTTIFAAGDDGYTWVRRPGSAAPTAAPRGASHALTLALRGASTPSFEFTAAIRHDDASVYHVGGRHSLFRHLAVAPPAAVSAVLTALGAGLRRLHSTALQVEDLPCFEDLPGPVHLRRLERCLAGEVATTATERLRRVLWSTLGQARLDDAAQWLGYFCAAPNGVLLHGGPGLGSIVQTESPARPTALLSGEDVSLGDRHLDLGWICGELIEIHQASRTPVGALRLRQYEQFARDICAAYGGPMDFSVLGRACALRMLTHAYDFAAYVGWHDSIEWQLARVAAVIDATRAGPGCIEDLFSLDQPG